MPARAPLSSPAQTRTTPVPIACPIQWEPRTATPQAIAEQMAREGDVRRYEPTEIALAAVRRARSATPGQLAAWCYHPDERVPLALLANTRLSGKRADQRRLIGSAIWFRAMAAAQREGVVWTPLLDTILVRQLWPERWQVTPSDHGAFQDLTEPFTKSPAWMPPDGLVVWRTAEEQIQHDWFRTESDREALARPLTLASSVAVREVLRVNPHLDDATFEQCLAFAEESGAAIAASRARSSAQQARAITWAVDGVLGLRPLAPVRSLPFDHRSRPKWTPYLTLSECSRYHLTPGHPAFPREDVERLFQAAESSDDPKPGSAAAEARATLLWFTLALGEADLARMLAFQGVSSHVIARIAESPQATPELWRRALALAPNQKRLPKHLSQQRAALADPTFRLMLAQSTDGTIARRAFEHLTADEIIAHLAPLARKHPDLTLTALERHWAQLRTVFAASDLQGFFAAARTQEIRLRAMALLADLDPDAPGRRHVVRTRRPARGGVA